GSAREPRVRGHRAADRLRPDDLAALCRRENDRGPDPGPGTPQAARGRHRLRLSGRGAGARLPGGVLDRAHPGAARARARQPARAAPEEPAPRARRRLRRAREGGSVRVDHRRRGGARGAAGAARATLARRAHGAAARIGKGTAAQARRAQRSRFRRVGARRSALRADGDGQGMKAVCVLMVIFLVSACTAARRPAPVEDRRPAAAPAAKAPAAVEAGVPTPEASYTVKKGDTLYSIALEHGHDYRDLAMWNSLEDPTKLRVGQVLRMTAPAVVVGAGRAGRRVESRPLDPGQQKPAPQIQKPSEEPRLLESEPMRFA